MTLINILTMILTKYTTYPYTICDNFVAGDKFKEKKNVCRDKGGKICFNLALNLYT